MPFQPAPCEILLYAPQHNGWLYFHRPLKIFNVYQLAEILPALQEIEQQVTHQGHFAAGFVSYEAAPAFDSAFQVHAPRPTDLPLLWFGLYDAPSLLSAEAVSGTAEHLPGSWAPDIDEQTYQTALQQIKDYIARGDTYQVNFTYRLQAHLTVSAYSLFATLARAHQPPYAAFLETDTWTLCSLSPEVFFHLDGETLTSRPMKGTAPRGRMLRDDQAQAEWLYNSEKNRAENVMIVDMVRNDMGRIARIGSVRVPELFKIEKYHTVWQMTSTVQAETTAGLPEVFQALFPCASITGAPKVRTMQIIRELETSPRQIYTGAIGYYAPGRQAQFNVAIRTLQFDKRLGQAQYGVGGGIVWDSDPNEEWQETLTKARPLFARPQPFELLETLRWTPQEGWFLLDLHLDRLAQSAAYFAFSIDLQDVRQQLQILAATFSAAPQRVRLKLSRAGQIHLEHQPLPTTPPPTRVVIAQNPIHSSDRFLYHKTTRREVYDQARAETPDCEDVLLWNERGELTESTIANLVVELDGQLFTPSVDCGLLPGTYRAHLLASGQARERVIRLEELEHCSRIFLANSVRGMWAIQVEKSIVY